MKGILKTIITALGLRTILIDIAITALKEVIAKIAYPPLQVYATYLTVELAAVVDVVTDSNPDNTAQLKNLWQRDKDTFIENTGETTKAIANTVLKDPKIQYVVNNLITDLETVLKTGIAPPQLAAYSNTLDWTHIKLDDTQNPIF